MKRPRSWIAGILLSEELRKEVFMRHKNRNTFEVCHARHSPVTPTTVSDVAWLAPRAFLYNSYWGWSTATLQQLHDLQYQVIE